MGTIKVDLNTRILPSDHMIYLARPGKQSRLYSAFYASSVIGPDLPRLELKSGKKIESYDDVAERIKRSVRVKNWIKAGSPASSTPPSALADYKGKHNVNSVAQHLAIINGYFAKARKGDFALMYPHSFNQDAVLFEFTEEPTRVRTTKIPQYYGNEDISVRRVRRLATINKRKLPARIIDTIQKPNVFVQLEFSLRDFFYNLAFNQYLFEDEYSARFDVAGAEYSVRDDFLLKAFINYVGANMLNDDETSKSAVIPFREAAFRNLNDLAPELSTQVSSPGFHQLRSTLAIPLVAAVLFALATQFRPDEALAAIDAGKVVIGNSAAPNGDACTAAVSESVINYLKLTGIYHDWPKACEFAREAAKSADISTGISVKEE